MTGDMRCALQRLVNSGVADTHGMPYENGELMSFRHTKALQITGRLRVHLTNW